MKLSLNSVPFILIVLCAAAGFLAPTSSTSPSLLPAGPINSGDVAWMITASGLVLLMTPGLAFFYGGMVSAKNVISTMLQSFIALGVVSLTWVTIGFSLSFGDSIGGVIGNPFSFPFLAGVGGSTSAALAPTIPLLLFALFQMKFAIITPALITGACAERMKFSASLLFTTLFSIFIYPPLAHMTWHPEGLLRTWGVLDFAGGTVVHLSAGIAALVGALYVGPRTAAASGVSAAPANLPFVLLGTGMLWFGWFGFNAGSALAANETAAQAFLTTNTASAAAMLTWIFFDMAVGKRPTALGACIGAVVGLVAITPAAGFVTLAGSISIGVIAALISNLACHYRATKTSLDDTLDVFPCHGVGGIVGMLLTAVFAKDVGLLTGETATFLAHLAALAIAIPFTFAGSYILFKVVDLLITVRVSAIEERVGLDLVDHGEGAATRAVEESQEYVNTSRAA